MTAQLAKRSPIEVEVIEDFDSLIALEPLWNRLFEASGCACPFLEHAWIATWWECFGRGSKLHILVLKSDGSPVAIVPLVVTRVRMYGLSIRRIGFPYNSHVPRADFLIADRHDEVYKVVWKHLTSQGGWDLIQFCQLTGDSPTLEAVRQFAEAEGYRSGTWPSDSSPYLPLESSWPEYFATLATKHRSNLRNRFKRLAALGEVHVEEIVSHRGLPEALEDGFRIEAAAWKGDAGTAIASDSDISRFYEMFAKRAADQGWLRLRFLCVGPKRIAFDYSLNYKNRTYLLKIGYDPVYSPYSPSNLLLCRVLETAFQEGQAEYDFLGTNADWKKCWTPHVRPYLWFFLFSRNLKGRYLHAVKYGLIPALKEARSQRLPQSLRSLRSRWISGARS